MCDRPHKMFITGYKNNGKLDLIFADSEVHHVYRDRNGNIHRSYDKYVGANEIDVFDKFISVPCGTCFTCRMDRASQWVLRCVHELEYHTCASFITFTYDSAHVRVRDWIDEDTGECGSSYTLFYKDFQDYMKLLRKKYPNNDIRFICAGEYGDKTKRPHYHAVIFGYEPPHELDMIVQYNKHGDPLYDNTEIAQMWKNGYITYAPATVETICYVVQYTLKKAFNNEDYIYKKRGLEPPMLHMSTKPAIGKRWYEDNQPDLNMPMHYGSQGGVLTVNPPRYYEKLYERDNGPLAGLKKAFRADVSIGSARNKDNLQFDCRTEPFKSVQSETKERRHRGQVQERDF